MWLGERDRRSSCCFLPGSWLGGKVADARSRAQRAPAILLAAAAVRGASGPYAARPLLGAPRWFGALSAASGSARSCAVLLAFFSFPVLRWGRGGGSPHSQPPLALRRSQRTGRFLRNRCTRCRPRGHILAHSLLPLGALPLIATPAHTLFRAPPCSRPRRCHSPAWRGLAVAALAAALAALPPVSVKSAHRVLGGAQFLRISRLRVLPGPPPVARGR